MTAIQPPEHDSRCFKHRLPASASSVREPILKPHHEHAVFGLTTATRFGRQPSGQLWTASYSLPAPACDDGRQFGLLDRLRSYI